MVRSSSSLSPTGIFLFGDKIKDVDRKGHKITFGNAFRYLGFLVIHHRQELILCLSFANKNRNPREGERQTTEELVRLHGGLPIHDQEVGHYNKKAGTKLREDNKSCDSQIALEY